MLRKVFLSATVSIKRVKKFHNQTPIKWSSAEEVFIVQTPLCQKPHEVTQSEPSEQQSEQEALPPVLPVLQKKQQDVPKILIDIWNLFSEGGK